MTTAGRLETAKKLDALARTLGLKGGTFWFEFFDEQPNHVVRKNNGV